MTEEKIFEVKIDKLVYGGEGMGRLPDGRAVFVPFVLTGEEVRIRLVEEKRGFARAELLEVLSPVETRIAPRCKHFADCGGCHYQHMPYEVQAQAKRAIMIDQLERIGKLKDPPVEEVQAAPEPWEYRNHVQFHQDEEGRLGYQATRSHQVVAIEECFLPEAELGELWPQLKLEPLPGLARLGLRLGAEGELLLVLETFEDEALEFEVDFPIAAVQAGPETTYVLADRHYLVMDVLGRSFRVSAEAFFQVNTKMAEEMVRFLLDNLPLTPETTLLDLYCGVGLFSAFLAPKVGQLIGVEEHPGAVQDFEVNLDEFENVDVYEAPVEEALPHLKVKPDVVVVDPPRAGLGTKVMDALLEASPQFLAYVSCDPATLARDAKRLEKGGYKLKRVQPFDLFPQTYHIESISFWEKKGDI